MIAIIERARLLAWLLVAALAAPLPIAAQQPSPAAQQAPSTQPGVNSAFTPEQLEQVVAPIALYPDPLLAQVLMASTYPLEVVEAARFVKANPNLKEDQLNEKLKEQTWDDSVKSLVSFPQALELMDQKLDWVQRLGDAFLAQQKDVLDAVQRLRARAQKEGNLKSTPEQKVSVEPAPAAPSAPPASGQQTVVVQQQPAQIITIEPTNPQVVYVPSYNPTVVYGAWPYPAYPPAYPYPPGYAFGAAALSFGLGMAVGAAAWGNCNWGGGEVNINNSNYQNYTKNVNRQNVAAERSARVEQRQSGGGRSQWQHSPENRKGVQYRDQATQQRYNRGSNPQAAQSREAFRGRAEQGRQDMGRGDAGRSPGGGAPGGARGQGGQGPGGGQAGAGRGQGGQGIGGGQAGGRGDVGGGGGGGRGDFGGGQSSVGGRGGGGGGAFQGAGSGGDARNFSNRGQSSRQSMGGAGGGASRPAGGGGGGGRAGGGGGGGGRGGGRR